MNRKAFEWYSIINRGRGTKILFIKFDDGNPTIEKKIVCSISPKQSTIKFGVINLQNIYLSFWETLNCYVYLPLKEN